MTGGASGGSECLIPFAAVGTENQYHLGEISQRPVQVDDTFAEYLVHVGGLAEGEWVYVALVDDVHGEDGIIVEAEIVVESIAPMSFVLN